MTTITRTVLADLTISMLERTAMVLAEPASDADEHPRATRFARITYRGPSQGTLVLGADEGFLREVAASLLGVDTAEVQIDTHGCDALREMANILAGSLIHAMAGEACEYSLGLPEPVAIEEVPGQDDATAGTRCTVVGEQGALHVHWRPASVARAA
jgi:CheY-specific phosphatase CheX